MSAIEAIEEAIEGLACDELAKFRDWFSDYDSEKWDAQIDQDAESGKLDQLASKALADFDAGRVKAL